MSSLSVYPPQSQYQHSPLRIVRDESSPPYDAEFLGRVHESTTVTETEAPVDAVVFAEHGWMTLGFYRSLLLMEDDGLPLSYGTIEDHLQVSRSVVMRMMRKLVASGAVTIERTKGGRGNESSINCVRNCVQNYVPTDTVRKETVSQTVSETVSVPPTPPVNYVKNVNPPIGPPKAKTIANKPIPIPDPFPVTVEMREKAVEYGVPRAFVDIETDKFCFHHGSKGNKFVDWHLAWLKWMRTFAGWESQRSPNGRPLLPLKDV